MDNQTDYFLLLGDLAGSTGLSGEGAEAAMATLKVELARWTEHCADELVAGLDLNYGDEFAGLFTSPRRIYEITDGLRDALRGQVAFRFVLARGRIGVASDQTSQMGGPVFVTANDALKRLKIEGRFAQVVSQDPLADQTLTVLIEAAHQLRLEMTDYQYDVFQQLRAGRSQRAIAKALGKFEQSVSDAAKRGHAELVITLDRAIRSNLAALSMDNH